MSVYVHAQERDTTWGFAVDNLCAFAFGPALTFLFLGRARSSPLTRALLVLPVRDGGCGGGGVLGVTALTRAAIARSRHTGLMS